jgi:hypothetical protein
VWLGSVKYGCLWFSFSVSVGEEEGIADDGESLEVGHVTVQLSSVLACLSLFSIHSHFSHIPPEKNRPKRDTLSYIAPSLLCGYVRLLLEGSCVHTYSQDLSHSPNAVFSLRSCLTSLSAFCRALRYRGLIVASHVYTDLLTLLLQQADQVDSTSPATYTPIDNYNLSDLSGKQIRISGGSLLRSSSVPYLEPS